MTVRAAVVALIVLATAGFVVGTALERNSTHRESPAALRSEGRSGATHVEGGAERKAARAAEGAGTTKATHVEFRPLGINIEAIPFIVLAALASLALAVAAWTRPRPAVLGVVAAAMLFFAVLDIREVFHQVDESQTGLAILAGIVAALHLAAAATAAASASRARVAVSQRVESGLS